VVANVSRTLRANGNKKVPIYKGAEKPMIENGGTTEKEQTFFGKDGLGDTPTESPELLESDWNAHEKGEHAAVALTKIFTENSDLVLVCIGPLTNIALALKLEPKFAKRPKAIVLMGGNVHAMGNVKPNSTAEFNFSYDPEAAHIVLKEMRCPITVIPWETFVLESSKVSKTIKITHGFIERH
jgi:inosine-uridine nucleoside N-ribohydrolase